MRPGQPRSRESSRGVNMQSFTPREIIYALCRGDVAVIRRRRGSTAVDPHVLDEPRVLRTVEERELLRHARRRRAEVRRDERIAVADGRTGRRRVERTGDLLDDEADDAAGHACGDGRTVV